MNDATSRKPWGGGYEHLPLEDRVNICRNCDLFISTRLYGLIAKWDLDEKDFLHKGPYYTLEEHIRVCDTIIGILEEYLVEKNRGKLRWSGTLSWDDSQDKPCWIILDDQGDMMPDVWPESTGLKDGDSFEVLADAENFIWLQTTIRQDENCVWYLEGTNYKGDLEGVEVRQDSYITFDELQRIRKDS